MDLTKMINIGKTMREKLQSVEINTAEELRELGSKEAYYRLKLKYPEVCLVHLQTLQAAIDNVDFNMLPQDVKDDLKKFSDSLK